MKMRTAILIAALVAVCNIGLAADPAQGTPLTVSVDKKPALVMTLPDKWTSKDSEEKTILIPEKKYPHIQLWNVKDAKSVEDARSKVADIIKSEVTEFKVKESKDVTVAGSTGCDIVGTGAEADDGDHSNAEVFLFAVTGKVFVLCVHGEGDEAAKQKSNVMQILGTVKSPGK